jgi:hypothetical protein
MSPIVQLPPTTASTVSVAVLSEVAHRYALSPRAPVFRSGWMDSSGMGGSRVRAWVADFTAIQARCDATTDWTVRALAASRLWGIQDPGEERPRVVVDVGSGRVYLDSEPVGSVWDRYRRGAGFRESAWWVEGLWRG